MFVPQFSEYLYLSHNRVIVPQYLCFVDDPHKVFLIATLTSASVYSSIATFVHYSTHAVLVSNQLVTVVVGR